MTKEQARKVLDIFLSEDEDVAEVISIKYLHERYGDHYFELKTKVTEENKILPNGVENDGLSILMVCEDGNVLALPM
jgi:hypothetical protein